jgi:hypothetical protein
MFMNLTLDLTNCDAHIIVAYGYIQFFHVVVISLVKRAWGFGVK